jgi:hypothetical protein
MFLLVLGGYRGFAGLEPKVLVLISKTQIGIRSDIWNQFQNWNLNLFFDKPDWNQILSSIYVWNWYEN